MARPRGLTELMAAMADGNDETRRAPAVSHVGQIARLREFKKRLDAGNPFVVGDLVTPRTDVPVRGAGIPHLVVAVNEDAPHDFNGDPSMQVYGSKRDLRVAHFYGENLCMHWVQAVDFEPYIAEVHERADAERREAE